ncbi:hypothetical protein Riv7116_6731 [Rivularia sp. PCC 7116]|nr:hypothetical protein Riv7116_6731 [Rivularia sp. PCC 7116]
MLVPLTREKFEQLIPLIATGSQYKYYWGKFSDLLQRLLISVIIATVILLIEVILRLPLGPVVFCFGLVGALYWLWGPVLWASLRNAKLRRYKYAGFFRGRVLDWWVTEELVGTQETVNNKGDLVIVENREKRINLEVGDESGFTALLKAPLKNSHKIIQSGQVAEMLVMSNNPDLSRIEEITDIYIPNRNLWVSDYPVLRQDFFNQVSRRVRDDREEIPRNRRRRPPQERSREIDRYYDDEREAYPRERSREIDRYYDDEGEPLPRERSRDVDRYYDEDERQPYPREKSRDVDRYYDEDERQPYPREKSRDVDRYYDEDEREPLPRKRNRDTQRYYDDSERESYSRKRSRDIERRPTYDDDEW